MVELLAKEGVKASLRFSTSQALRFELTSESTNDFGVSTKVVIQMHGKPDSQKELWEVFPQCKSFALVISDFDKAEREPLSYFCAGRHTLRAV